MKKGNAGIIVLIIALFVVVLALAAYMVYDFTKDNLKDITDKGSELIGNAAGQLSSLSHALQNQIVQSFDGKAMSGAKVLAACIQYQNSNDLSVKIIVSKDKEFNIGRHNVKIEETVKQTLTEAKEGAVNVTIIGENTSPNSLTEIQSQYGVNASQIYYSYVMKNPTTGDVIGIIFVKKDWNKENTDNKDHNVQNNEQSSSNNNDNANNNTNKEEENTLTDTVLKNILNSIKSSNFKSIEIEELNENYNSITTIKNSDYSFAKELLDIVKKYDYKKIEAHSLPNSNCIYIEYGTNYICIHYLKNSKVVRINYGSGDTWTVWETNSADATAILKVIDNYKRENIQKDAL